MTLDTERQQLFETGSHFAPAQREDIAGIENTLQQIDVVINWLSNSPRFSERKSRLQPGLLFEGEPGTGKTLSARYIATASNALFINLRDWPMEGDVISDKDLGALFSLARNTYNSTKRPIILFWDEFEGYAPDRRQISSNLRASSVVSRLTAELDGVHGKCEGILLVGCTNYKDSIDSALLRAGRMGLHIKFNPPDELGKSKLLEHYLSRFNIEDDVDYTSCAFFFENQDTAATVEEAAQRVWLQAVFESLSTDREPIITNTLATSVLLDRLLGPAPPFMELRPDTYKRVAIHELGHALAARGNNVPIKVITIKPGETSFGRTYFRTPYDKIATMDDKVNLIAASVGSGIAEEITGLIASAAYSHDTKQASRLALELSHWNRTDTLLNLEAYDTRMHFLQDGISNEEKLEYDKTAKDILEHAVDLARFAVTGAGPDLILRLTDRLVVDQTWTGPQFEGVFEELK